MVIQPSSMAAALSSSAAHGSTARFHQRLEATSSIASRADFDYRGGSRGQRFSVADGIWGCVFSQVITTDGRILTC